MLKYHEESLPQIKCQLPACPPIYTSPQRRRTYNSHIRSYLCAGLASCNPKFLSQEWDLLIPQAVLTLNLLHSSRTNPSLSAYTAIKCNFNFNGTPLAPPGTKVLVHEEASNRPSFSTHAVNGWYIFSSLKHYLCYHCYIPTTASTRHANTVKFFQKYFNFPKVTDSTYLRQAAEDIVRILSNKHTNYSHPSLSFGSPILNSYLQVTQILLLAVQTPLPLLHKLTRTMKNSPHLFRGCARHHFRGWNPPPLPRVPTTHRYPTRHTRHNQPRPVVSTAAAVINTTTGAKSSLQTL